VIDNGVTGFIVSDESEAVAAIARARTLDRAAVRERFEERFSVDRMVRDYVKLYESSPRPRQLDRARQAAS
jgi:glycosyltransferase involved in cell wall biosynthesis